MPLHSADSFRNPFAEYNANVMDSTTILRYWCSPFDFASNDFAEKDVYSDKMPIVFMGGRGSGKTMFLKYWSYFVQRDLATVTHTPSQNPHRLLDHFREQGAIGVYVRIDGPQLRNFHERNVDEKQWDVIFTHFFELTICYSLLQPLAELARLGELDTTSVTERFLPQLSVALGCPLLPSLDAAIAYVDTLLTEVHSFRNTLLLSPHHFSPTTIYGPQSLTVGVPRLISEHLPEFSSQLVFVVFLDEYENFLAYQQRLVNTLIKFTTAALRWRLGMRLEGFRTYDTISRDEFIKEGRDYRKVVFEDVLIKNDKHYRTFLLNVAKRRLESVPVFREMGHIDIAKILGNKEDLEQESLKVVHGRKPQHFAPLDKSGNAKSSEVRDLLRCPDRPLLEMLNVVLVMRGGDPQEVASAMNEYLNKHESARADKYRMDFVDKYKLSLMFLLASLHKRQKLYYSFNTFCFLSSGIVGNFIELCRSCFQIASFEEPERLLREGVISPEIQNQAARAVSRTELDMITRISQYGDKMNIFVRNLGNIFRAYHTDIYLRYPETNQVAVDVSELAGTPEQQVFRAAVEWSLLQRKPELQRSAPSSARKDIYTLNRILSPIFEITYRTRGGYSEDYGPNDLRERMSTPGVKPQAPSRSAATDLQRTFDF